FLEAFDQRAQRLVDDHRRIDCDLAFLARAFEDFLFAVWAAVHGDIVGGLREGGCHRGHCKRAEQRKAKADRSRDFHAMSSLHYLAARSSSSLCCPRSGAAVATRGGVALSRTGLPTTETVPRLACGRSLRMSSAWTCGSANTSSMVLSGPVGTSSASRAF